MMKRTSMEVIRIDLKKCNLYKYLARDKSEWTNITHVAEPNTVATRL